MLGGRSVNGPLGNVSGLGANGDSHPRRKERCGFAAWQSASESRLLHLARRSRCVLVSEVSQLSAYPSGSFTSGNELRLRTFRQLLQGLAQHNAPGSADLSAWPEKLVASISHLSTRTISASNIVNLPAARVLDHHVRVSCLISSNTHTTAPHPIFWL